MDYTPIILALIGGVFSLIGAWSSWWIREHVKDTAAAATLDNAMKNSVGAIQFAVQSAVTNGRPAPAYPVMIGVHYVETQAASELLRFPEINRDALIDKVSARIGNTNVASNVATAASSEPTQPPLAAVLPPPVGLHDALQNAAAPSLAAMAGELSRSGSPMRKGKV